MTWLATARAYLGVTEIPGPQSHPTILGWAKGLGGWVASWFRDDDTPWCALFVWHVLQQHGFPVKSGAALVRAKAFVDYGTPLDTPALGCIVVFDRAGGGHVGFYVGETLKAYRVLGGNQNNRVSEAWLAKDRCVAMRWPPGAVPPAVGRKWLRPDAEPVSENER